MELVRISNVIGGAFQISEIIRHPQRSLVVEEILQHVRAVCNGDITIDEFSAYQDRISAKLENSFLGDQHPGITASYWGIFMIMIDPLKYGKKVHHRIT
jgi:mannitol-1-phosphate/altronate dehydrogenase